MHHTLKLLTHHIVVQPLGCQLVNYTPMIVNVLIKLVLLLEDHYHLQIVIATLLVDVLIMEIMIILLHALLLLELVLVLLQLMIMVMILLIRQDVINGNLVVHTEALVIMVVKKDHVLTMSVQINQIQHLIHNVIIGYKHALLIV